MNASITPEQRQSVINAIDTDPKLARLLVAMVQASRSCELEAKSSKTLTKATAVLPKPKAAPTQAGGRHETVDNHSAVVGKITVHGELLDILLSDGSFGKTRADQVSYAEKLGYRFATREEHLVYVRSLLAQERSKVITTAESYALTMYRERFVRDTEGGLAVNRRFIQAKVVDFDDYAGPGSGALFVRTR